MQTNLEACAASVNGIDSDEAGLLEALRRINRDVGQVVQRAVGILSRSLVSRTSSERARGTEAERRRSSGRPKARL